MHPHSLIIPFSFFTYIQLLYLTTLHAAPELAEKFGMEFLNGTTIPKESPQDVYQQVAENMQAFNPDILITCILTEFKTWNDALREIDWSPKAHIYTLVVGTPEFEEALGTDVQYIMGMSSWDRALPPIPDVATGWTPKDFDVAFEQAAFRRPAYQHTAQSAALSVLVQALERVGAINPDLQDQVRQEITTGYFPTVFGNVSFDVNGQNSVPTLFLQYDKNATLHVLLPESLVSTDFQLVYPMPTWSARDCTVLSECAITGGFCDRDGTCACPQEGATSTGVGETAVCIPAVENESLMRYLGIVIPIAVLVVLILAVYVYKVNHKVKYDDSVWLVEKDQLQFAEPPEVIGRGSFGLILMAEYRGTKVAVKRAIPPKEGKEGKKHGKKAHERNTSFDDHWTKKDELKQSHAKRMSIDVIDGDVLAKLQKSFNDDDSGDGSVSSAGRSNLGTRSGESSGTASSMGVSGKRRGRRRTGMVNKGSDSGGGHTKSFEELKKDFISEMRYVSKLRHPCIVTVMGTYALVSIAFLV